MTETTEVADRPRATASAPSQAPSSTRDPSGSERAERANGTHAGQDDSTETRLARLAAGAGPLRRVLAAIAARLLETRAFERLCYARLGDYARERPGISVRQIEDLARVHRALADLPGLEHALLTNLLPWSKVRLVARVATPADEHAWIARAGAIPTRQLEREVRSPPRSPESVAPASSERLDDRESETAPERRIVLRCTPAVREKWNVVCEMAERVAGQRLRSADVLELVAAEAFSELSIDPLAAGGPSETEVPGRPCERSPDEPGAGAAHHGYVPPERQRASGLPDAIASLAAGLELADAFELDRRLLRAIRLEQSLDAAIAPLLRRVRSAEYEWREGYRPLTDYAPDQLGMSASKARALLRLERAGDVCPELREAWRGGRISWVKAQCLAPLLLLDLPGEWRPVWVAWAERVTLRRLALDVERALLLRAGHHRAWQRCQFYPERTQDPIPPDERQLCAPDVDPEATQRLDWRVPQDVALLFQGVHRTLRVRLESERRRRLSDGQVFDALLDSVLRTWTLHEPGRRRPDPVIERDGYRCTVPGCTSRRNLHDHHIVFRSALGSDAPSNRTTLCAFHHHRCLHAGRMRLRGRAPDQLVFELGVRPGGPPLARYRDGDVMLCAC